MGTNVACGHLTRDRADAMGMRIVDILKMLDGPGSGLLRWIVLYLFSSYSSSVSVVDD